MARVDCACDFAAVAVTSCDFCGMESCISSSSLSSTRSLAVVTHLRKSSIVCLRSPPSSGFSSRTPDCKIDSWRRKNDRFISSIAACSWVLCCLSDDIVVSLRCRYARCASRICVLRRYCRISFCFPCGRLTEHAREEVIQVFCVVRSNTHICGSGILRIYPRSPPSLLPSGSDSHIIRILARARALTRWLCSFLTPHCTVLVVQLGKLPIATTLPKHLRLGPNQIGGSDCLGGFLDPRGSYLWK